MGDFTARVQAQFASEVTPENEVLIRTLHRSLETCSRLAVHEGNDGHIIWLVLKVDNMTRIWDTHAAGRKIHIFPDFELPPLYMPRYRPDPLIGRINSRLILKPSDLRIIRDYFPGSVGVRVLICGSVLILFETRKAMKASWELGPMDTIGGQRIGFTTARYELTSNTIASGYAVTDKPDDFMRFQGCLGLHLRLPSGQEAITTSTHNFVKCLISSSKLRL